MLRKGSSVIIDFIADNLAKEPVDTVLFSSNELNFIETIEKKKLPAYNTRLYANGIYRTWADFANQVPEIVELNVKISGKGQVKAVEKKNEKGKFEELSLKDVYAFVYEGKPYVVTDYGCYLIERKIGDFFFTGRAKNLGNENSVTTAAIFFGIAGALIASEGSTLMEMKIDHLTGGFIRLRPARQ
jgi:hypothetical protein